MNYEKLEKVAEELEGMNLKGIQNTMEDVGLYSTGEVIENARIYEVFQHELYDGKFTSEKECRQDMYEYLLDNPNVLKEGDDALNYSEESDVTRSNVLFGDEDYEVELSDVGYKEVNGFCELINENRDVLESIEEIKESQLINLPKQLKSMALAGKLQESLSQKEFVKPKVVRKI